MVGALQFRATRCQAHGWLMIEVLLVLPDEPPRTVALAVGGRFGYQTLLPRRDT